MATAIELSSREIQGLCQRYLQNGTQNHDFQVLSYKLQPASEAPAGFLGRHERLSVVILHKDAEDEQSQQTLHFFTKSAPSDIASRMEYIEEFGVFKKEVLVYSEVLPELQKIFPDVAPHCYYATPTQLVFEDLGQQGYRMAAARDGLLNYVHLKCGLKTLAALHAASIVYEVRQGKKIPELFPEAVVENAYPSGISQEHVRRQNFNNANLVFCEIIKNLPKYAANLDYILAEFPKRMEAIYELIPASSKYQNVFSHGDIWANNLMFRYGNYGEMPIQCRFVDFQLARYAPAALDLMTLLSIPTSRHFREQHLDELLSEYHRYMAEFLKREKLCIDDFMPRAHLEQSAAEYRICGLIESLLFSHLTILPPALTQELTGSTDGFSDFFNRRRVEFCMRAFHTDEMYRDRLTDMIEDMVDNFVLKQQ